MFNVVRFLEETRPIDPLNTGDLQGFIDAAIQQLRGHVVKIPGRQSLRYPQAPKLLEPIRDVLEASAPPTRNEIRVPALRELLFRPGRVYLEKVDAGGAAAATLLSAFHDPAAEDPVVIELRLLFDQPLGVGASYISADDAADCLQGIYMRTELSGRIVLPGPRRAPQLAWLGGSVSEDATPADWRERIEAAAAVRGFNAQIFEQPYRHFEVVRRGVHDAGTTAVMVWVPYAGKPTGWSTIPAGAGGGLHMIEINEASFEDALLDATMQLDEWVAAGYEGAQDIAADVPESGEVRVYKKEYATPGHDVMVRSNDCGHNAWEHAHKAPKAQKGIAKLEPSAKIAALEKCMDCTGGGRWRVTFT